MNSRYLLTLTKSLTTEMAKPGYYAVRHGRKVGIYRTWAECEAQVKGFPGARYKKFGTNHEAEEFINQQDGQSSLSTDFGVKKNFSFKSKHQTNNLGFSKSKTSDWSYSTSRKTRLLPKDFDFDSSKDSLSTIPIVYTDGCCLGNGKSKAIGGIGVYWGPNHPRNISEHFNVAKPTNQKAELEAAIRAIKSAQEMGLDSIEIRTDSSYTIKSMTEWIPKWEKNGWKTSSNTDVLNKDQMIRLNYLCSQVNIKWTHVPGHRGVHGNEMADKLANEGALGRGF